MMSDKFLDAIASNVIAGFLAQFGMVPSGGDSMEVKDYGPHRVWTIQAKVPPEIADTIDQGEVFKALVEYLARHNAIVTAVPFNAYNVEIYVCPCGCGTFLYSSIYQ